MRAAAEVRCRGLSSGSTHDNHSAGLHRGHDDCGIDHRYREQVGRFVSHCRAAADMISSTAATWLPMLRLLWLEQKQL